MYKVLITNSAQKSVRNIPDDYYEVIVKHISELAKNPRPNGSIKLSGFKDTYRIRVGIYRIIYIVKDEIITVNVIKIDHRSSVYKK